METDGRVSPAPRRGAGAYLAAARQAEPVAPRQRYAAAGLVVLSAFVAQFGAALAMQLIRGSSPEAASWFRNLVGGLALVALVVARGGRLGAIELRPAIYLGLILGAMNTTFYEAISRLPLGDAVAVEFVGPVAVAALTASHRRNLLWIALAAAGVVAISRPGPDHLDYVGLLFVGAAATLWAGYILVGRRVATGPSRHETLAGAMLIAVVFLTIPALLRSGSALLHPNVFEIGIVVGVLSSAIPYGVELMALQRVPPAIFGVLLSLQPVMAGVMGVLVLGQPIHALDALGFVLVMAASVGVTVLTPGAAKPVEAPAPI